MKHMKLKKQTYIAALLLISLLAIAGCTQGNTQNNTGNNTNTSGNESRFCAQDVKICSDGTAVGRDPENGCAFPPCPNETYFISRSQQECSLIKFMCIQGKRPFFNEDGCGCEPIPEENQTTNGTITMCGALRPQACTKEYMPVCGLVQVQCIRAPCPPINMTFGNKCEACANSLTVSYTNGICPLEE